MRMIIVKKCLPLGVGVLAMLMMMALLNTNPCGATTTAELGSYSTAAPAAAFTIADSNEEELEFLMDSETSRRMLAAAVNSNAYNSLRAKVPFCTKQNYQNCIPDPNTGKIPETRSPYKRRGS